MNYNCKYIILIFIVFISCNEKNNNFNNSKKYFLNGRTSYVFHVKDSILKPKDTLKGWIEYKGVFDTITTELLGANGRYVKYLYSIEKEMINKKHVKISDTLGAVKNNIIPVLIGNLPEKSGVYYMNGIIKDRVFLPVPSSKKHRMLTNDIPVSFKFEIKD